MIPHAAKSSNTRGFTLVELLTVIGIIVLLMALVMPAMNGIKGGTDLKSATTEISGTLEQARAYAMANNTFVYVGFQEVDVSKADSATPQTSGTGRLAVAVVASKDGTRFPTSALTTNIVAISKLQRFENLHMGPPATTIARPTQNNVLVSDGSIDLAAEAFSWPLGGTAKYKFKRVIEFDPQGVPRPPQGSPSKGWTETIVSRLEIGLRQSKGNTDIASATESAIQLDGVTGASTIYRP